MRDRVDENGAAYAGGQLQTPLYVNKRTREQVADAAMRRYVERDLEHDVQALAVRARHERDFAGELYGGLCNADWRHEDGTTWPGGSWRYVADLVAHLRGRCEDYLDFYCSGGEGEITDRLTESMSALGWRGVGHGSPLRKVDLLTGESQVLDEDDEWVDVPAGPP